MNDNPTVFVAKEMQDQGITRLINDIHEKTALSKDKIRYHSQNAIQTWENVTKKQSLNLSSEKKDVIRNTIAEILYYFETEFFPLIADQKTMSQTLKIARVNFEYMFGIS